MFWDSVCPSFTGNTLSSTNWLSPLLGGHCCLCSSIQKFKKLFTFSVLQDRGLVLKELSSRSDSSEDTRRTWRAENRSPSLSSSVTVFSLLSSFYIQKREREKKNSVIQLIFCIKHHMPTEKLLLYWLSEPQHCCKKLSPSER